MFKFRILTSAVFVVLFGELLLAGDVQAEPLKREGRAIVQLELAAGGGSEIDTDDCEVSEKYSDIATSFMDFSSDTGSSSGSVEVSCSGLVKDQFGNLAGDSQGKINFDYSEDFTGGDGDQLRNLRLFGDISLQAEADDGFPRIEAQSNDRNAGENLDCEGDGDPNCLPLTGYIMAFEVAEQAPFFASIEPSLYSGEGQHLARIRFFLTLLDGPPETLFDIIGGQNILLGAVEWGEWTTLPELFDQPVDLFDQFILEPGIYGLYFVIEGVVSDGASDGQPATLDFLFEADFRLGCDFRGTDGPDEYIGSGLPEVICGFGGNDKLRGRGGDDIIFGGEGDDNINGNMGDDLIFGGPGEDILYGKSGKDEIDGGEGDDIIEGGALDDRLLGRDGNDEIHGEAGWDVILGGAGDDTITGGPGLDHIGGGDGHDNIEGENGTDTIFGGEGDDYIDGGFNDDMLYGEAGRDKILGRFGNDWIEGGPGRDVLKGGGDNDTIKAADGERDRVDGDAGDDTADVDAQDDVTEVETVNET